MYNSIGGFIVNVNDGGHCQGAAHCHLVMSDDGDVNGKDDDGVIIV